MARKPYPAFEKVEITDFGAEGNAIARVNDMVVFVKFVAPGDIVDLQVFKKRKRYMEARVTAFHHYSPNRAEPFCEHFGVCGGCKWQHIPYDQQVKFKQKQVSDALTRIGKLDLPPILPILKSPDETFYRNKLEFTFSNHRWFTKEEFDSGKSFDDTRALGFHVPGMFDKIVDIETCWLQPQPSNTIRNLIRDYARENSLTFYDQKEQSGLLRNLIIRTTSTGETMVILSFFSENKPEREKLLDYLNSKVPGINSLMYVINSKGNDTLYDQDILLHHGKDYITEKMEDLEFRISPKSFFQTNTFQSLELYKTARQFAGLTGNEIVYDLYTGTGTIANFVAKQAGKVIGIESVPQAIDDARLNSEINGIRNTDFFAGDIIKVFTDEFIAINGKPDVIITDPPRAGMHKDVVDQILRLLPDRIVYVSCNPATQARDLELMSGEYKITAVQPVDMFPHTHHVENVVKLERREVEVV